jgi:diguanylate cyclase (GGDEF)-like protein
MRQAAAEPDARPSAQELALLRRRYDELEVLFQTVRDLTSTLSTHEVIERLIERALVHFDAEIASVLLLEPDSTLRMMHARGLPEAVVQETRVRMGEGIAGHVAASGQALFVADVERDTRFSRPNHERYYTRSCISAPLLFQGRVRGVLNVNNKRCQQDFEEEDLLLLEAVAGHASVSLANARMYEEALERAQRDALTGLANHGRFWSALEDEVRRAHRYGRTLSVVMFDVDHFKAWNDRHGHRSGDSALIAVAKTLTARSRSNDTVARYGGEEFAAILPETSLEGACAFAEKIRQSVEAYPLEAEGNGISVSAGVATIAQQGEGGAAELVEAADRELYRAKALGRNRVCCQGEAESGIQ